MLCSLKIRINQNTNSPLQMVHHFTRKKKRQQKNAVKYYTFIMLRAICSVGETIATSSSKHKFQRLISE